ncbi:unnamed protein product [Heterosigma akashiwo]
MGKAASKPKARGPVPPGKTRLCVAGFGFSHHTGRARAIVEKICELQPEKYESWFYFDTKGFRDSGKFPHGGFLQQVREELSEEQQKEFANHRKSPFCWIETPSEDGKNKLVAIGGRDRLSEWAIANLPDTEFPGLQALTATGPSMKEVWFSAEPGTAAPTS